MPQSDVDGAAGGTINFRNTLVLTANAATSLGVNQANRTAGNASLALNNAVLDGNTTGSVTLTGDVGDQAGANAHPMLNSASSR